MSLVQAYVGAERAYLCADSGTSADSAGKLRATASKLMPLAGVNAVAAYRGYAAFGGFVLLELLFCGLDDFDELVTLAPQLCARAFIRLEQMVRGGAVPASLDYGSEILPVDRQELTLVGWSPRKRSLVGFIFFQASRGEGFKVTEIKYGDMAAAPWDSMRWGPIPARRPKSIEHFVELAKLQDKKAREDGLTVPFLGDLVIAEVTKERTIIWRRSVFPKGPTYAR